MLGTPNRRPPRSERLLAAVFVALYPLSLKGHPADQDDVEMWDRLRADYLGLHRGAPRRADAMAPPGVTD